MEAAAAGNVTDPACDCIRELMVAVDENVPTPARDVDRPFLMPVEDVFTITGRGTVVTGRIERGVITTGSKVEIVGLRPTQESTCTGVEMFKRTLDRGEAGDNAGLLLRGIEREQVERGQVIAAPGSIKPHAKFKAQVYVLKKDEGGRHRAFESGYKPQFYFRTTDVTGEINLPEGVQMVMPGDHVNMEVTLQKTIAMEEGVRFAIREGGRTIGAGAVTEILE